MDEQYVVLEYNQASGMPRVAADDVFLSLDEAVAAAAPLIEETKRVGRRERYVVAALDVVWRGDDDGEAGRG